MRSLPFYCLLAFIFGSMPTAYWTARRLKGIDIRQHGSGNAGATNVTRVLGRGPGYFVFAIDFLKGFFPVFIYSHPNSLHSPNQEKMLLVGACAVLGHVFSPWLGFKGGKGVATGAGMLAAAVPVNFLIALISWVLLFLVTRTVSVSSLFLRSLLGYRDCFLNSPAQQSLYFFYYSFLYSGLIVRT